MSRIPAYRGLLAVTAGAARRAPIPDISERAPSTIEEVVTVVLEFFVLYSRI
jgi:hypothetical protein